MRCSPSAPTRHDRSAPVPSSLRAWFAATTTPESESRPHRGGKPYLQSRDCAASYFGEALSPEFAVTANIQGTRKRTQGTSKRTRPDFNFSTQ